MLTQPFPTQACEPVVVYRTPDGLIWDSPEDAEAHASVRQLRAEYEAGHGIFARINVATFDEVMEWLEDHPSLARRMVALATVME